LRFVTIYIWLRGFRPTCSRMSAYILLQEQALYMIMVSLHVSATLQLFCSVYTYMYIILGVTYPGLSSSNQSIHWLKTLISIVRALLWRFSSSCSRQRSTPLSTYTQRKLMSCLKAYHSTNYQATSHYSSSNTNEVSFLIVHHHHQLLLFRKRSSGSSQSTGRYQ